MLFLSSSSWQGTDFKAFLKAAADAGIRHIELSGGFDEAPDSAGFFEPYMRDGFVFKVHNYYPPPHEGHFILNIASVDEPLRRKSVDFATRAMDLASALGSDIYSIHSGYAVALNLAEGGEHFALAGGGFSDRGAGLEALAASVDELCAHGRANGVRLALENLFPPETGQNYSYMCSPEDLDWAVSKFQRHDNFGFLLDLAHARIAAGLLGFDFHGFVERAIMSARVLDLHISGTAGVRDEHDLPDPQGVLVQLLQKLHAEIGSATLETRNHTFADVAAHYHKLHSLL